MGVLHCQQFDESVRKSAFVCVEFTDRHHPADAGMANKVACRL